MRSRGVLLLIALGQKVFKRTGRKVKAVFVPEFQLVATYRLRYAFVYRFVQHSAIFV